jgi:hypothetical protein
MRQANIMPKADKYVNTMTSLERGYYQKAKDDKLFLVDELHDIWYSPEQFKRTCILYPKPQHITPKNRHSWCFMKADELVEWLEITKLNTQREINSVEKGDWND